MKIIQRLLSAVLCIGLSYGNLGLMQMAYADAKEVSEATPPVVKSERFTLPVDSEEKEAPAIPAAPAPGPVSPPANVPLATVPSATKAGHLDTPPAFKPPSFNEQPAAPMPVNAGICRDLFNTYSAEEFCSSTALAGDTGARTRLLETLYSCINYAYKNECTVHPLLAKIGVLSKKKQKKAYDPKKVFNNAFPAIKKTARQKAKFVVDFDKQFPGLPFSVAQGRSTQQIKTATLEECSAIANGIVHDNSPEGMSLDSLKEQCRFHAQTAASANFAVSNFSASAGHSAAGNINQCKVVYNQGWEIWSASQEHEKIIDGNRAKGNAKNTPKKVGLLGRSDIGARKNAGRFAPGVERNIDLADQCETGKKKGGWLKWVLILALIIALIMFLKKKKGSSGGGGGGGSPGSNPPTSKPPTGCKENCGPTPPKPPKPPEAPGNGNNPSINGAGAGSIQINPNTGNGGGASSGNGSTTKNTGGVPGNNSGNGNVGSNFGGVPGNPTGTSNSNGGGIRTEGNVTRVLAPK